MKYILIIMLFASCINAQIRHEIQNYDSATTLRNETLIPSNNDKVYVRSLNHIYTYESGDNSSIDDGLYILVQGSYRWRCVDCDIFRLKYTQDSSGIVLVVNGNNVDSIDFINNVSNIQPSTNITYADTIVNVDFADGNCSVLNKYIEIIGLQGTQIVDSLFRIDTLFCNKVVDESNIYVVSHIQTSCGVATDTLELTFTQSSNIITNINGISCSAPFVVCTDCSTYSFRHAMYDFDSGGFWNMDDKPAKVIPGATHDQTTTTGTLEYSINGAPFVTGPAGTVTPTMLKLSLLPFTEIPGQSYVVIRWTSTNGLVNEVSYLRSYTADQIAFSPPYSHSTKQYLTFPNFYSGCPAYGVEYDVENPAGITTGTSQDWTNIFMNLNMTFNGNTISPSKYSCPIGYCSAGVQVLPPSYYVDGINTVVTNQTHPGDATGPAITLNIRNDFYLQCNP